MGRFFQNTESYPITDQIKSLGDDELLDFWEETQFLDKYFNEQVETQADFSLEYERLILMELQLRSCLRNLELK